MTSRRAGWGDPRRCALLVIDLQNDYCHPSGALAATGQDVSAAAGAAAKAAELLVAARAAGAPCVHLRSEHSQWTDTPEWLARGDAGNLLDPRKIPIARAGSWGAAPFQIEAAAGDRVLVKHRYSGFAHTPLELTLRAVDRDVAVLTGVTSDLCVRATGLDALARGFTPVLVADATAAADPDRHAGACREFASYLGPVVTSAELIDAWAPAASKSAAAEPATLDTAGGSR
ncbi:MAG: isochorismatase family cysteine hydrolase [Micromonosporaceae bacterium]